MRPGAAPLEEQLAVGVLGPPIVATLWWLASRGLALVIQGGSISEKTQRRQKKEFRVLLVTMYVLAIGVILYAALTPGD
jgi:hypothetical protein